MLATDSFTLAGLCLGLLGIVGLFIAATIGRKKNPNLAEGVVVFLSGSALCGGVKICALAVMSTTLGVDQGARVYIFLGGLAEVWISIDTIVTSIRDLAKRGTEHVAERVPP